MGYVIPCDPHCWLQHDLFRADRQVVFVRTSGNHTFEERPYSQNRA